MAKNNWKKHDGILKEIKKIVKKKPCMTTNQIVSELQNRGYEITWKTVRAYLDHLEKSAFINSEIVAGGITNWNACTIKP